MGKSLLVFRNQLALFKREKGMIVFYCLYIAINGVIVPIFMRGVESALTMAALFTAMFLKPMLSDSMAGERERRTLETLLSSPINGKSIILGKFLFSLAFSLCIYGMTALCGALTNWLSGYATTLAAWQWLCVMLLAVFCFSAISIAGVYASARSADMRAANSRVSLIAYPLGLLFLVYITITISVDFYPAIITGFVLLLIYLCVILICAFRIFNLKQSDYFENLKSKKVGKKHGNSASFIVPRSQFGIVLGFELKYLLTLKMLSLFFGVMCLGPALVACLLPYYATGGIDLNYAVFVTVLMIPRVPLNLIAYSIGGEKVYRTGESLLSTPLRVRPLFLAKCAVPILVSAAMLVLSSLFTLMGAAIVGRITPEIAQVNGYTIEQLVLLFPVGIMASMMMVFISAILSLILKTPRHGLYATSAISFLFVIPVLAIVYLAHNTLMWSLLYSAVLLIGNAICIVKISGNVSRPEIMGRL